MLTFTDDLKILGTAIKYLDSFDSKLKLKSYRSRIRFRCGFGFRMRMLPTFFQIVDALNIHYFHHIIVGWFSRRYSNPFPDLFLAVEAAAAVATAAAGVAAAGSGGGSGDRVGRLGRSSGFFQRRLSVRGHRLFGVDDSVVQSGHFIA